MSRSRRSPNPCRPESTAPVKRRVVPQSVISRQLANPFLAPDLDAARQVQVRAQPAGRLGAAGPAPALLRDAQAAAPPRAWPCPPAPPRAPAGPDLMPHQAQVVAAAAAGHRTFLLADEPGLGKTAQALLAADAAGAYPLLVVVPNVVKTNWAREVGLWTPHRTATVDPRRRGHDRRLRRHRHRELRGPRPARRLAGRPRLPRHGRRRGALHQEQVLAALPARPGDLPADPRPDRPAAAHGPDRHPADQRPRGLPGHLAVPRLDRRDQADRRADGLPRGDRPRPGRPRLLPECAAHA